MDHRILYAAQQAQNQAWLPPATSRYHAIISLLLSQRISFTQSRHLRQSLYTALNTTEFTPNLLATLKPELKAMIPSKFHRIIDRVTALALTNQLDWIQLGQIDGIGPWTIKGAKLMTREDDDIFLAEDLYIRQRLRELYDLPTIPTIRQARMMAQVWGGSHSLVSRFLWRLRPAGAKRLREGHPIQQSDLI
jgi:3-methyladenine DNA glycosylase/8-oxoguanine DNA glycosylase